MKSIQAVRLTRSLFIFFSSSMYLPLKKRESASPTYESFDVWEWNFSIPASRLAECDFLQGCHDQVSSPTLSPMWYSLIQTCRIPAIFTIAMDGAMIICCNLIPKICFTPPCFSRAVVGITFLIYVYSKCWSGWNFISLSLSSLLNQTRITRQLTDDHHTLNFQPSTLRLDPMLLNNRTETTLAA